MNIKLLSLSAILFSTIFTGSISAKEVSIEPEADQILLNMSNYLDSLDKYSIKSTSTIESMLDSGQKIMIDHENEVSVQRPNRFSGTRKGDAVDQSFYYDGKNFTLYGHPKNEYKIIRASSNISDTLVIVKNQFKLVAPGADLLGKNVYKKLSNELLSGFYVDTTIIDGVECYHLAFRNTEVDWQIWVQTGETPLPKRYVVTSRWVTGAPQFVLDMNWNTNPNFSKDSFSFVAPKNATQLK